MGALRGLLQVAALIAVGGLLVSGLRAAADERSGPPSAVAKTAGHRGGAGQSQKKKSVTTTKKTTSETATRKSTTATTTTKPTSSATTKKTTSTTQTKSTRNTTNKRQSTTSRSATTQRRGYWYSTGPNRTRRVALTYDDCPRSLADFKRVAVGAEKLGIGLMLFPTGDCLRSGRFSAAFARANGHYVFNHSISHPDLARLTYGEVLRQLEEPGVQSRYGRPPFGSYSPTVARAYAARGMRIWTWSVDTLDWRGRSMQSVVSTAVHSPRAGGTVLMHMQWHGFSVSALRQMKAGLDKRGLGTCRNFGITPVRSWTVRC